MKGYQIVTSDEVLAEVKTPENLKAYVEQITERRGRDVYVCPICGSGDGPNHTAAFNLNGKGQWHCFAKCNRGGDILDLIGEVEGLQGFKDRLARAAEFCGIDYDQPAKSKPPVRKAAKKEPEPQDYSIGQAHEAAYIASTLPNIDLAANYLQERGWTVDEARKFGIGYDPKRERLIIPWPGSDYYHCDRAIGSTGPKYLYPHSETDGGKHPIEVCVGPKPIYNPQALDEKAFVVVEGAMDAMALMRIGTGAVIALGGTGYNMLMDELKDRHYQGCVIAMLDNDKTGKRQNKELCKALANAGIAHMEASYPSNSNSKDPDELCREMDYDKARRFFDRLIEQGRDIADGTDRNPNMRLHKPMDVLTRISRQDDADTPIPTGLDSLDEIIGGGLMRGLYILGATSSFGKTTLTLQVADCVAAAGHAALFVTIEQSAQEIVAKSLSRLSHDRSKSKYGGITAQPITTATARDEWGPYEWERYHMAVYEYSGAIAANLRILEGIARPSITDVRIAAEKMADEYGEPPAIFLDYLQLLAPYNERFTDKQAVDYNVTALRIMARELKTPVWCVATLNRDSYSGPVDLDSFKESGSIEYGADYLFGLQPRGIAQVVDGENNVTKKKIEGNKFVAEAKKPDKNPRSVELTVLKNRNGETTGTSKGLAMSYYPRTNLFSEG